MMLNVDRCGLLASRTAVTAAAAAAADAKYVYLNVWHIIHFLLFYFCSFSKSEFNIPQFLYKSKCAVVYTGDGLIYSGQGEAQSDRHFFSTFFLNRVKSERNNVYEGDVCSRAEQPQ